MKQSKFKETEIGKIPEEWSVKKLSEFCNILMGQSPPSSAYNPNEEGLPFFQGRKDFGMKFPAKKMWCSEPTRIANAGDVLLSVRAPVGDINVAVEKCCIGRGLSALSMKKENKEFLYYLILYNRWRLKQIFESEGTVFGCVTKDGLRDFEVGLPIEETEQRAIAKILSDLDFNIELNRQINKTLEKIGQALFKHWFVNFEFIHSSDCRVNELGKHVEFIKGKKPNKISEAYLTGYRPQILIENLNGKEPLYANKDGMTIVGMDEPIMVMDGASSGRVEIGHGGILGSTLAKVIATSDWISNLFLYYFLKSKESEINQNTTGTSIPHADKGRIKKFQCILPSMDILESFNKIARIILNKIIVNKKEIKILSQICDSLLPRLMSGRIRVKL